jgi:predicted cobalt transporter CbtA
MAVSAVGRASPNDSSNGNVLRLDSPTFLVMEALAVLVLGAVLGAVLGYFVRRNEHLRDKRLDAI